MNRPAEIGTCLLLTAVYSIPLSAQSIAGTVHDFRVSSWNPTGEICIVCHTPHEADVTVTSGPLWNHEVTTAAYVTYSSATMHATVPGPDGDAKLCLSCHDGTVALDNFGGSGGGTNFITGSALVGTDLTGEHPVSFTYDTSLATADGDLFDPATTPSGLGGTIAADLLFSGKLQCGSCHDVHAKSGVASLLRKDNTGSALCLTCHDK